MLNAIRHKQATAKMLDYTGNTIANKTERSQSGVSRLLIDKFDKIKSGHFPPNVFRFGINIVSFACNWQNLIICFFLLCPIKMDVGRRNHLIVHMKIQQVKFWNKYHVSFKFKNVI